MIASISVVTCLCMNLLQDFWPEIALEGFEPETFGSVFRSEARRRAADWCTLEFPGQLIALLLAAQWLKPWCASLVAQVLILAVLFKVSY